MRNMARNILLSNYLVKASKAVSKLCVQRLSSPWTKEHFPAHCSRLPLICDPTVGMRHGHALSPLIHALTSVGRKPEHQGLLTFCYALDLDN